jgi:Heterokaryon incompatibility protein (HET)
MSESQKTRTTVSLGRFADIASRSNCQSCQDLNRAIRRSKLSEHLAELDEQSEVTYKEPDILFYTILAGRGTQGLNLHPVRPSSFETRVLHRRAFQLDRFDLSLAKRWIHHCDTYHGATCRESPKDLQSALADLILVDLQRDCLVDESSKVSFATLSYVWGPVTMTRATRDTIDLFRRPRSLLHSLTQLDIPETIRDAMQLTQSLGIRYLWIDSLCIVQDDESSLQKYLPAMASIYAMSTLTIVAAEGENAHLGLRGSGGNSRNRDPPWPVVRFPGRATMVYMSGSELAIDSKWDKRAWTYQEKLFARRMLIFDGIVSWSCRTCHWREDEIFPDEGISKGPSSVNTQRSVIRVLEDAPVLSQYFGAVNEFNSRDLSFEKDVPNAFAGILTIMGRKFDGGFFYGLPQLSFDFALLWQPDRWNTQSVRRRVSETTGDILPSLPSWSWFGWKGKLEWPMYWQSVELEPLCELFAVSDTTKQKCRIGIPLNGTSWGPYYGNQWLPATGNRHEATISCGPYLHFRTERAWFTIDAPEVTWAHNNRQYVFCSLKDEEGNYAGSITLNDVAERVSRANPVGLENYFYPKPGQVPSGERCELIALSRCKVLKSSALSYRGPDLEELYLRDRPQQNANSPYYSFYNVLWISWRDGIAYRNAWGRVIRHVWERIQREPVDVVLG